MKHVPIVAIVGRANVGKSSLFNAILGSKEAIVAKEPGTTRDSIMGKATFAGHDFWLVDTAGIKEAEDDFEFTIQEQISQAIDSCDVIWVVIEVNQAISDEDRRVAKQALKSKKPVFLVVNKVDQNRSIELSYFNKFGIKTILGTSTTQMIGIEELLEELSEVIPKASINYDKDRVRLSIIGRPNVGKSKLFNALINKQQAIVATQAGTTRDLNKKIIKFKNKEIEIIDTAGIRRSGKIERGVEKFSVIRTLSAIEQSDVCLLLMDVNELNVALDQKIAGLIQEAGKGLVLVISKWDSLDEKTPYSFDQMAKTIQNNFQFVPWAPLIFTSSITGQNVAKIYPLVLEIVQKRAQRFKTPQLNRWLKEVIELHPPAGLKNRTPKLNYIVQEDDNSMPSFKIFGSQTGYLHWSYKRFMEKQFRNKYDLVGSPLKFWFIEKHISHRHGKSPTKN